MHLNLFKNDKKIKKKMMKYVIISTNDFIGNQNAYSTLVCVYFVCHETLKMKWHFRIEYGNEILSPGMVMGE